MLGGPITINFFTNFNLHKPLNKNMNMVYYCNKNSKKKKKVDLKCFYFRFLFSKI